jgi:hypothetical protein
VTEGEPQVTDYVLVTNAYAEHDARSTRPIVWFDPPRQIEGDTWIGQVDQDLASALLDACDSKGENWHAYRQYGCSYALYRTNAPAPPGHEVHFDHDSLLYTCVALSRLVHPTSVGFGYAARVRVWRNGARQVIPTSHVHLSPHAFVTDPNENWLLPADIPLLAQLVKAVRQRPPTGRLAAAMWHHEALSRHYYIDLRWPLLTAALEALVKIPNERLPNGRFAGSTKVFVDRLLAIGAMDASLAISESDLEAIYEQRSLLAHGLPFGNLDPRRKQLYRAQERLARGIIRKALLEPGFRVTFDSDLALATALPLQP